MKTWILRISILTIAFICLPLGCKKDKMRDIPRSSTGSLKPTKVSLTIWEQEMDQVATIFKKHLKKFMSINPDITIEMVHYANEDLRQQFQTAGLAGSGPELIMAPSDFAGPFSIMGIIRPVDKDLFVDMNRFTKLLIDAITIDSKVWGIPVSAGNHLMLYYNKKFVNEKQIPKTTKALIQSAKALKSKPELEWGFAFFINEPFWIIPWLGGFGGWPLDAANKPTLNTPAMVSTLAFLKKLKDDGVVPRECDYNCADSLFKEQKVAMIINGDWAQPVYKKELGLNLGIATIPVISETGKPATPMVGGKFIMVNNRVPASSIPAIRMLLDFITSEEFQKQQITEMGRIPAIKSLEGELNKEPLMKASYRQLVTGRPMPVAVEMRACWDAMRPNLQDLLSGRKTPEKAAASMQKEVEKKIREMKGQ